MQVEIGMHDCPRNYSFYGLIIGCKYYNHNPYIYFTGDHASLVGGSSWEGNMFL